MVVPVNITKPHDIAMIFAIFALVVVTVGFGLQSVVDRQNVTEVDTSFYTNVQLRVNSTQGLKGAADDVSTGLTGQEGASVTPSEESILLSGFNSVLRLGKTFRAMSDSLSEGGALLGIDPIYWLIFTSLMLITFGVVMYTWIRGR